jgi:hypothetical protein
MKKTRSFAAITADWEQLLAAAEANRDDIPQAEAFRVQLEASLEDFRALHAQRAALEANRLRSTQELKIALDRGVVLAGRIRAWVRGQYGIHDDKLVEFGMKPWRKRKPRGRPAAGGGEERAPRKPTEP